MKCYILIFVIIIFVFNAKNSNASSQSAIYSFSGGSDGSNPSENPAGNLLVDTVGALYGMTSTGSGTSVFGTIFKLSPPAIGQTNWTKTIIHEFTGGTDGITPIGGLVMDSSGALYGATYSGGSGCNNSTSCGYGTVFKLMPPALENTAWTETILYRFTGKKNNMNPLGVIFGPNGALYGATDNNNLTVHGSNFGSIFCLIPPPVAGGAWTQETVYTFKGSKANPGNPTGGLTFDATGALYGVSNGVGQPGTGEGLQSGDLFKLVSASVGKFPWKLTILYAFGTKDVGNFDPSGGLVLDAGGNVYTTALTSSTSNSGAVVMLTPPAPGKKAWSLSTLHQFGSVGDGFYPAGAITRDTSGSLYGATSYSVNEGDSNGVCCGITYKITPPAAGFGPWTETILYNFQGDSNGGYTSSGLAFGSSGNMLYGTTSSGGANGDGVVYEITP